MSDDSFIREVNEELRQDQARALWERYGKILIGVVILVVLGTAAIVFWRDYQEKQAARSGDRFLAAIEKADEGDRDAALVELQALQTEGAGEYGELARFKRASVLADEGSTNEALQLFDEIAADGGAPETLRDFASLRAGYLLVDQNDYNAVAQRVERLANDNNSLRFSAREALGLAAWKAGRADDAQKLFQGISDEAAAPGNLKRRANLMLELIASGASANDGLAQGESTAPAQDASEAGAVDEAAPQPADTPIDEPSPEIKQDSPDGEG